MAKCWPAPQRRLSRSSAIVVCGRLRADLGQGPLAGAVRGDDPVTVTERVRQPHEQAPGRFPVGVGPDDRLGQLDGEPVAAGRERRVGRVQPGAGYQLIQPLAALVGPDGGDRREVGTAVGDLAARTSSSRSRSSPALRRGLAEQPGQAPGLGHHPDLGVQPHQSPFGVLHQQIGDDLAQLEHRPAAGRRTRNRRAGRRTAHRAAPPGRRPRRPGWPGRPAVPGSCSGPD